MTPEHAGRRGAVLSGESGYTLTEMLVVLAILSTVLAGLTTVFVSGVRAEADLNTRFEAQQEARVALSKLRREIWCASQTFTTAPSAATIVSAVAANTAFCKVGTRTWCTVSVAGAINHYALYRKAGATCDATGTRMADHLTDSGVFTLLPAVCNSRRQLEVELSIDPDPADARRHYRLVDAITMRGSARTAC